jgi:hypothetical protein
MGKARLFAFLLLLAAAAFAEECRPAATGVVVGTDSACSGGVPVDKASVYISEDYYLCGTVFDNEGAPYSGKVAFANPDIMPMTVAQAENGKFSVKGTTGAVPHKVYFITGSLEDAPAPGAGCSNTFQIPLEVRDSCVLVPPSTIQAIPNVVTRGESFVIEVGNSPIDMRMTITGLKASITADVRKGEKFQRAVASSQCADEGPCTLRFAFQDPKHPICSNSDTTLEVRVTPPRTTPPAGLPDTTGIAVAILIIVLVGTAVTVVLNRFTD